MAKDQKDKAAQHNSLKDTGSFVQENQKSLSFIGGAIIVLILLYFGYQKFYLAPRAEKAANEMFKAEEYAAVDSLSDRAIKGDGSYPGFEKIADEYSGTKSANIANAYLGGLYLQKGEYQKAIEALGNYSSTGSPVIDPLVLGMTGDAYSELKEYDKAITYYKKAADKNDNSFTAPMFLKKLGLVYEQQKDYDAALDAYKKIKNKYPESSEAMNIDEYIARNEARSK
ncbi:tetratricopeptide repeat protein (plasmid) [Pedobacter sp. BS3]|uniref:tetratricopeptide repeat protein n=1 Tax=Pedobacter sp. BS3 TaxID=2567937 RepID=UPI0011EE2755|nr:tetratricopeptide repeat protein [Pedobacter sp. BS3]TZF85967.1 tetratricopeptide repeat protein [Pedobacter sp. BS3]